MRQLEGSTDRYFDSGATHLCTMIVQKSALENASCTF
jgi:hypothetical protein